MVDLSHLNRVFALVPNVVLEAFCHLMCDSRLKSFAAEGQVLDLALHFVDVFSVDVGLELSRELFRSGGQFCVICREEKPLNFARMVLRLLFQDTFGNFEEVVEDERVDERSAAAEKQLHCFDNEIDFEPLVLDVLELLSQLGLVNHLIELDGLSHGVEFRVVVGEPSHVGSWQSICCRSDTIAAAVASPVLSTNPAEFVVTLTACNVMAASVLLDVDSALRALLGEANDPVSGAQSRCFDLLELLHELAWNQVVSLRVAGEAKLEAAEAAHGGLVRNTHINLDGVGAVRRGTPFDQSTVDDEATGNQLLVLRLEFLRKHFVDKVIINGHVAVVTRTFDAVGKVALIDGSFDVQLETIAAKEVAAVQLVDELKRGF